MGNRIAEDADDPRLSANGLGRHTWLIGDCRLQIADSRTRAQNLRPHFYAEAGAKVSSAFFFRDERDFFTVCPSRNAAWAAASRAIGTR